MAVKTPEVNAGGTKPGSGEKEGFPPHAASVPPLRRASACCDPPTTAIASERVGLGLVTPISRPHCTIFPDESIANVVVFPASSTCACVESIPATAISVKQAVSFKVRNIKIFSGSKPSSMISVPINPSPNRLLPSTLSLLTIRSPRAAE